MSLHNEALRHALPSTRTALAAVLLASGLLTACVVAPARAYRQGGEIVTLVPPAPQVEVYGVAPAPGWFWIGGYWGWKAGRHVWIGGHWEAPRGGYRWEPHRWHRDGNGWREAPGHWEPQ